MDHDSLYKYICNTTHVYHQNMKLEIQRILAPELRCCDTLKAFLTGCQGVLLLSALTINTCEDHLDPGLRPCVVVPCQAWGRLHHLGVDQTRRTHQID